MKVFVSHSHADAELAAQVSRALRNKGLDVWDRDLNLLPGDNWAAEVARALEESDAMVGMAGCRLAANHRSGPAGGALAGLDAGTRVHSARVAARQGPASGKRCTIGVQHLEKAAAAEGSGELLRGHLAPAVIVSECVTERLDR